MLDFQFECFGGRDVKGDRGNTCLKERMLEAQRK